MANKIYQAAETALVWTDTSGDYAMTLNGLAAEAGRQGAVHDFGVAARAAPHGWRAWFRAATTPVTGEQVEVYAKTSDGSRPDNDDGTGDIALSSADKLRNLHLLGVIIVDQAATGVTFAASGLVWLPHRYVMPVLYNATADAFVASDDVCGFSLTAVPPEVQ